MSVRQRSQVFISYSHKDAAWLQKLQTMLKPITRNHTITIWDDTHIKPGTRWREEILGALASAKVAVLLVSPHFLASDFIDKDELPSLLKAAEEEGVAILWAAVSASLYEATAITDYQPMNNPARPLDSLRPSDRNKELKRIATKIIEAASLPLRPSRGDSMAIAPYSKAMPEEEQEELTRQEPGELGESGPASHEAIRRRYKQIARKAIVTIPVVVHVVYRKDEGNISDKQIRSQIDALNRDFRAKNPDLAKVPETFREHIGDTRIEFALATKDPSGNPTTGVTRTRTMMGPFSHVDEVQAFATGGADPWDTKACLNIWVCTLGRERLGAAQYPGGPSNTDGIVIHNRAFGTMGTVVPPFNLGRTAVGRVGKYLNLLPIWGRVVGCNPSDSDLVADTPIQLGPNYGKPVFPLVSCGNGPNGDMFMNFMDDVDDDTMFMFTKGQVVRMHETLEGSRRGLVAKDNWALS
jgi:hypothetical protein